LTRSLCVGLYLLLSACGSGGRSSPTTTLGTPTVAPTNEPSAAATTAPTAAPATSPTTPPTSSTVEVDRQTAPTRTDYETPQGVVRLLCAGAGQTPVVLLAGGVDPPTVWDDIVAALGDGVLTCRFDAAAITSDITPSIRAEALSAALDGSGMRGPFVLVGHSLGGLTVRQFGAAHPDQLGGVVLLDATTPMALLSAQADLAGLGWDVATMQADAEAPVTWPDVPLEVLAHDPATLTMGSEALETLWTQGQQLYATLTPLGHYEIVPHSGHFIYVDAVDRVVSAINDVVASADSR
jgi:pimeloyl-ACP methyl ester carboxylesterase